MTEFSNNLKYLRKSKGLSQEELAGKIGLNRGNIASYEKGTAEPKLENLLKIIRFFKVDLSDMLAVDLKSKNDYIEHSNSPTNGSFEIKDELLNNQFKLEKLITNSNQIKKILDGFKLYHEMQINTKSDHISEEVKKMAAEYEKLLLLSEKILEINHELISNINN